MSLGASGAVAKSIVFSHWKGRPYVRQLVTPSNPRSAGQRASRAMMSFLSKAWSDAIMTTNAKATWDTLSKQKIISPFNAFVGRNRSNYTQFLAPIHEPADARTGTLPTLAAPTLTGGVGEINITDVVTTIANGWGIMFFLNATPGFTPAASDLRLIINTAGFTNGQTAKGTITDLAHGSSWYWSYAAFTSDGHFASPAAAAGPVNVT